jgi:flagellar basal-body rod modification protein FlgD
MQIYHPQAAQAAVAATPLTAPSSGPSGTSGASGNSTAGNSTSDSATITANDFLSLLVAEMQNQDPTADTDPNEYIDQLVQVNSLQQLISINQDLSGTSTSGSSATGQVAGTPSPLTGATLTQAIADRLSPQASSAAGEAGALPNVTSAPVSSSSSAMAASAERVASALSPAARNPDPPGFPMTGRPGLAAQP